MELDNFMRLTKIRSIVTESLSCLSVVEFGSTSRNFDRTGSRVLLLIRNVLNHDSVALVWKNTSTIWFIWMHSSWFAFIRSPSSALSKKTVRGLNCSKLMVNWTRIRTHWFLTDFIRSVRFMRDVTTFLLQFDSFCIDFSLLQRMLNNRK